jgi:ABC-type multidrug transport system fused ATPase/permease subunit
VSNNNHNGPAAAAHVDAIDVPPPPGQHISTRERLSALLGERKRTVAALSGLAVVSGLSESIIIGLIVEIAANAAKGSTSGHQQLGFLHIHASTDTLFLIAAPLVLFRILLQVPLATLPSRIAAGVQASLRRQVFAAYTRASWTVQSQDREGHLQETMTSQVLQATGGALQATALVIAGIQFVVILGWAIRVEPLAAAVIFGLAILLFLSLRPLNRIGQRLAKQLSRAQLDYAAGISETNRLAEDTQVFGVAEAQRRRVGRLIETARRLYFRTQIIVRLTPGLYQSAVLLVLVVALRVLTAAGSGRFVSLSYVILLMVRAGTYGQIVQTAYQGLRQSMPFIERLQNQMRYYADSEPHDGGRPLPPVETLAFERVSYAYRPGQPVLHELSFQVAAGEAIGIIGPSGAGKSTLIQLLLQLRRPGSGRFLVNGESVIDFARSDWQRRVAYVPQEPRLIHDTVSANIRFYRDIDDEAVERAAKLARIHEDVVTWPGGYEQVVGPRADAVSGGQQQRICLARALAAHPEVLVLDEPTSALDPHSERLIQASLDGLRHELTLFIIAHRMSTLEVCDRVMVILDGRLAAFDTVALLQRSNPYYKSAVSLAAGGKLP